MFELSTQAMLVAMVGGVALLLQPFRFDAAKKASGLLMKLSPNDEQMMRQATSSTGCALNDHFREFASTRWRALLLPDSLKDIASTDAPAYLELEPKYLKAFGVTAKPIDSLAVVVPALLLPAAAPDDDDVAPADAGPPDADQADFSIPTSTAAMQAAGFAAEHVRSLAKARGGGAASHSYEPATLIQCLLLKSKLKPKVSLQDALAACAPLLFGSLASIDLVGELRDGSLQLPMHTVLSDAQVRLDILEIAFERHRFGEFKCWRYPSIDASSSHGNMWFMSRECVFRFPSAEDAAGWVDTPLPGDLNAALTNRTLPMSTLGRGRASLVNKSFNDINLLKMESPTQAAFEERCSQVFGIVADQGTEKGMADIGRLDGGGGGSADAEDSMQAFPNAMWMPEHLHIFNNALEHAICSLTMWKLFLPKLRALERFLQDVSLRRLFQAVCLAAHPAISSMFKSYSGSHVDWRWEYLELSLVALVDLIPFLMEYLDVEAMLRSEEGNIDPHVLRDARAALDTPYFLEFCELVRCLGRVVYMFTHELEGCPCHKDIWTGPGCFRTRSQRMLRLTGFKTCYWKNRMGPWLQIMGLPRLEQTIRESTSDKLQIFLSRMTEAICFRRMLKII
jgi:hypothetical protein